MEAAAVEELVDFFWGGVEFGGGVDQVLSFDGVPVAALGVA